MKTENDDAWTEKIPPRTPPYGSTRPGPHEKGPGTRGPWGLANSPRPHQSLPVLTSPHENGSAE